MSNEKSAEDLWPARGLVGCVPSIEMKDLYKRPGRIIPVNGPVPDAPYSCLECHSVVDPGAPSIAQEAHDLVHGDRGEAYGHPIFDMTRSADMLTALLRDRLRPGTRLEAEDIAQAMICIKQSRHRNKPKRDNLVDTAGYALTLDMIKQWREENPGKDPRDHY